MTIMTSMKSAGGTAAANMAAKVERAAANARAKAEVAAAKAKAQAEAKAEKARAAAAAKAKAKLDKAIAAATVRLDKAKGQRDALTEFINNLEGKIQSRDLKEYMSFGSPSRKRRNNKNKNSGATLKQLQLLARRNRVNIYKMRKDGRGYTKSPLTKKALKARLSRYRISYNHLLKKRCAKTGKAKCNCKNNRASRPRSRTVRRKSYVSRTPVRINRLDPRRACPAGKYKDPATGICKTIPKYEDLDELDSVNFDWSSDRTFSNRPLSTQMYGRSCFGDIPPCDCGL